MEIKLASIAVYGPQGSGKTQNAQALAKLFGLTEIVDEAEPMRVNPFNTLYLTQERLMYVKSIPIAKAIEMLKGN